jgi:hypothetical protein
MSGPRREEISWRDLPRERQRRLLVLVGKLVRQRLAATPEVERSYEREPAERHPAAYGQDPGPAP